MASALVSASGNVGQRQVGLMQPLPHPFCRIPFSLSPLSHLLNQFNGGEVPPALFRPSPVSSLSNPSFSVHVHRWRLQPSPTPLSSLLSPSTPSKRSILQRRYEWSTAPSRSWPCRSHSGDQTLPKPWSCHSDSSETQAPSSWAARRWRWTWSQTTASGITWAWSKGAKGDLMNLVKSLKGQIWLDDNLMPETKTA